MSDYFALTLYIYMIVMGYWHYLIIGIDFVNYYLDPDYFNQLAELEELL